MKFIAEIDVMPHRELLDPQGSVQRPEVLGHKVNLAQAARSARHEPRAGAFGLVVEADDAR